MKLINYLNLIELKSQIFILFIQSRDIYNDISGCLNLAPIATFVTCPKILVFSS